MFAVLSKLAEILAQFGPGFLAHRRTTKDTDVATVLLSGVTAMQSLCVRGERLLTLAAELASGTALARSAEEFAALVDDQARAVRGLRAELEAAQALLATVDVGLYLELVPFLDDKSGLLTRWGHQADLSQFSTTTLFFLPGGTLDRVIEAGKGHVSQEGLDDDRSDYLLALADGMRSVRSDEVRDVTRSLTAHQVSVVEAEIATAQASLTRTKDFCGQLLDATREAVGPEVMAHLRRKLVAGN